MEQATGEAVYSSMSCVLLKGGSIRFNEYHILSIRHWCGAYICVWEVQSGGKFLPTPQEAIMLVIGGRDVKYIQSCRRSHIFTQIVVVGG